MLKIIDNKKIFLIISSVLVITSIIVLSVFGLKLGVDFVGGSLLEVKYINTRPEINVVKESLAKLNINDLTIKAAGEKSIILKFRNIDEDTHQAILHVLNNNTLGINTDSENGSEKIVEELSYDSVGPSIGEELKEKSIRAIFWVLITIVLFVAWAFKKVTRPISSWKYGIVAIITLFHDIIILCGTFSILGIIAGMEVGVSFVAALLTILGYSVNDTIVVFDRLRENLPKYNLAFKDTVNESVNQTIRRSINTSITTILALLCVFIWGGTTTQSFILALIVGISIGTYSSIFLASPLLVVWNEHQKK
ncbi:protein translocase subunit SecF [Patescibacteria group bacterium]|nr:protein translocase subunit SecF [Patescibacteria group bacterium]